MNLDTISRLTGYTLLGLFVVLLVAAIAHGNDQKRLVGFDAQRSLTAECIPGRVAFFTNRERLAVYMEKADGRVAAQPVYRGGEITALACDDSRGELVVSNTLGERRVHIARIRPEGSAYARMP